MKAGDLRVSLRSLISVRWKSHLPRLVIHEKFEKRAKWIVRFLTAAAILGSVIAFPAWYLSLSFAAFMFLIEQFVERCIFQYTTIYVQPMPDFALKTEEWKAMAFDFPQEPGPTLLNVVGCAFATREYAHKFFALLRDWNYDQKEDQDNNICLSFILEDESQYVTFLYANPRRHTVKESFDAIEEARKLEKYGKEHQRLVIHMLLGKSFPFGPDAMLKVFVQKQPEDRPFWLQPFLFHDGKPELIYDEDPILKHHFKFKCKKDLTPSEWEYHFLKIPRRG